MKTPLFRHSVTSLLCLVIAATSQAQTKSPYRPKLSNSKSGAFHDFPLGVLSATGRLSDGDHSILLKDVDETGVGYTGGLRTGDEIITISGERPTSFSSSTGTGLQGPQAALGEALAKARSNEPHELRLTIKREGEAKPLVITVPASPAFSESFPRDCPQSDAYLRAIADHLIATQMRNGSWRPGVGGDADVYMSAFCSLTLIADGRPSNLPVIKRAIAFIQQKSISQIDPDDPKVGPKSWQTASSAILLAEYHLATGDESVLPDLQKCCDLLSGRVSPTGTMGHHYMVGYEGGGLVIINTQAHLAWALAEKCGCKVDRDAWDRSLNEVVKSVDPKTGAVGYSSRAPWSPDIAARTGAITVALAIAGEQPKLVQQFAKSLAKHHGRMRHAHAMCSIGVIYGFAGLRLGDEEAHRDVMREWRPYLELAQSESGSAMYFGGKRNFGGDEYLGLGPIGNATIGLMLATGKDRLFMHGGQQRNWLQDSK